MVSRIVEEYKLKNGQTTIDSCCWLSRNILPPGNDLFVKMAEATPYLDPLSEAFFETVGSIPTDIPIEEFREQIEQIQKHKELGGITREKFVVPFEGGVTTWIYKPVGRGKEPLPVIFYVHGGAWIGGR